MIAKGIRQFGWPVAVGWNVRFDRGVQLWHGRKSSRLRPAKPTGKGVIHSDQPETRMLEFLMIRLPWRGAHLFSRCS